MRRDRLRRVGSRMMPDCHAGIQHTPPSDGRYGRAARFVTTWRPTRAFVKPSRGAVEIFRATCNEAVRGNVEGWLNLVNKQDLQWADLMRAANRGDTEAYRRLLAALAPALRSFALRAFTRSGLSGDEVEDAVQEALLAVHLKRHTWDEDQPLLPWVKAIARNKVIDALRRKGGSIHVPIDDVINTLVDGRAGDAGQAADVASAVSYLKGREREIVVAMSIEGASARDVAERLAMSEGAVRVALHRALKSLAKTLGSGTA